MTDIPSGVVEAVAHELYPGVYVTGFERRDARNVISAVLAACPAILPILQGTHVAVPAVQRVRHKKRGTTYTVLGEAILQAIFKIENECLVTIYRGDDDRLWARPVGEFADGRFEVIAAAQEG